MSGHDDRKFLCFISSPSSLWSVRRKSQRETLFIQRQNIFPASPCSLHPGRSSGPRTGSNQVPPLCTTVPSAPPRDDGAPSAVSPTERGGGCQSSREPHLDESHLRRDASLPAVRHHVIACGEDSDSDQLYLQADMPTLTNRASPSCLQPLPWKL